jgi:hypothetical protein
MNRFVSSPRLSSASKARCSNLARDVLGHVAGPALGGVKGDHAKRIRILAAQEIADDRFAISLGGISLVIGEAVLPVVVQNQVDGDILRRLRHAAGMVCTHTNTGFNSGQPGPFRGIVDDSTGRWRAANRPMGSLIRGAMKSSQFVKAFGRTF